MKDVEIPQNQDSASLLFKLRKVRKTYGTFRIPENLFRECRLAPRDRPQGKNWRSICGSHSLCHQACPRCWSLSVDVMDIQRGSITAILGHSGSGKTTLLYALALLHSPDSDLGAFEFCVSDNAPPLRFFQHERWLSSQGPVSASSLRRRHFGFVFQAGHLSSHMTVLQNVGLALGLAGVSAETIRRRGAELLGWIDFPLDRFDALPKHLSGGEYQRVAVARALAADPDVLFADEPTGNLDPVTGRTVMQALINWQNQAPMRSLILVTHNLDHALEFADHIFVLNGGRVVLEGTTDNLKKASIEEALHRRIDP